LFFGFNIFLFLFGFVVLFMFLGGGGKESVPPLFLMFFIVGFAAGFFLENPCRYA
jgi:hypothetical protein